MKRINSKAHRLTSLLILPLLFLFVGCDTGGSVVDDGFTRMESPWMEEAFRIDCSTPNGATVGVFTATGAITDKGTFEGPSLPWNQGLNTWRGYRMFEGKKGTIVLYLEVRFGSYGSFIAEGEFTILEGSEAYANLQGRGEFSATMDEERGPVEIFSGTILITKPSNPDHRTNNPAQPEEEEL